MTMGDEHQDHYSASIDLSNNCRKFYFNHLKTTEEFKKSVNLSRRRSSGQLNGTVKSRLDNAMEKLRTQMAELMDQDLSLMEQLLTLNDKIEEMKHKYMYSVSKDSLGTSSCNLSAYCDYTDSETSLASLDINDYNEDCLFGSDLDVGEMGTDDVFVERPVSIDDAFKQWVKKQMSDKDSDSDEGLSEEKQRASAGAENIKNIPKDQEKYPRCQSEGFIVSEQHGSDDFTENSELQTGETGSRILGLVTNGACASSPRKNNSGPAKAETHDNKVEMPDIKLDDTNEGNKLNPETKHLTLDFKSNISSERTNISFDSDDNLNLDDYDDTILNV